MRIKKLSKLIYPLVFVLFFGCINSKELTIRKMDGLSILEKKKKSILNIIESSFKNRFQNISKDKVEKFLTANDAMSMEVIAEDTLLIWSYVQPIGGFAISETIIAPKLSRDSGIMLTNNFNLVDRDFKITKIKDKNLVNQQQFNLFNFFTLSPNKYCSDLLNERAVKNSEIGVFINCLIIYKTESKNGYKYFSYSNFILN